MLGYGAVMPILPEYLRLFGGGAFEYGVLVAVFSVCAFLAAGPLGSLSDRIGRKPLILLSLVGASLAIAIFGLATSIILLLVARAAEGVFTAGLWPASDALVSDIAPPAKRSTSLGILLAGRTSGMIFGPALGGLLSHYLGIRFPFLFCAGLALLALFFCALLIHEPPHGGPPATAHTSFEEDNGSMTARFGRALRRYSALLQAGGVLLAVALIVRFTRLFSIALVEPMFAMYATDPRTFAFTSLDLGLFFFFFAVANALGQLLFGWLSDRIGHEAPLVLSGVVTAAAVLSAPLATTPLHLFIIGAFVGLGGAMALPSSAALAAEASPPEERGQVMGFLSMAGSLARATGPILGGASYALILASTDNPYQAAALPILFCAAASISGSLAALPLVFHSRHHGKNYAREEKL